MSASVFKRVLIKLSGQALQDEKHVSIDPERIEDISAQVREVWQRDVEIAIVVGAGNIFRGVAGSTRGMDRATGDYMGMVATVLNALALQDGMEKQGLDTRVQSAIDMQEVAEPLYAGVPSGTWRRSASSSSPPEPVTRISPPTRQQPCGHWRSTPKPS